MAWRGISSSFRGIYCNWPLRDLPSRTGVYFVLALGMFSHLGYARVWGKLTAGLTGLDLPSPSEKALRDLRRRSL